MLHRCHPRTDVLALVLLVLVAACGGGDEGGFKDCGNGVLDGGEECDDGNLNDGDACLSTCRFNVCGDFFVNAGVEQCEQGGLLGGKQCADLGFASGTLACSAECTFDTSRCAGAGTPPTATPADGVTPTPSETPVASGIATPTVVPTPAGSLCQAGDQFVLVAALDKSYGAARIDLLYPTSLNIPGTGTAQSVVDRVHFSVSGGLTTVSDHPEQGAADDTLTASLVGFTENAAGPFVTVTFDCVAGEVAPVTADFTCTVVSASTAGGVSIADERCSLTRQ
jgi:cysteine-rich repeat protein